MIKRFLPLIVLVAAAFLLFLVKKNQRGSFPRNHSTAIRVPVIMDENFNRHPANIIYSKHARCRMDCRHINEHEVIEILTKGQVNYAKMEEDSRGKRFPLEGITSDNQHVRIVFAPKEKNLEVVTVIDLDKDWDCDCRNP